MTGLDTHSPGLNLNHNPQFRTREAIISHTPQASLYIVYNLYDKTPTYLPLQYRHFIDQEINKVSTNKWNPTLSWTTWRRAGRRSSLRWASRFLPVKDQHYSGSISNGTERETTAPYTPPARYSWEKSGVSCLCYLLIFLFFFCCVDIQDH